MSSIAIKNQINNIKSMQDNLNSIYKQLSQVKISSTFREKYNYNFNRLVDGNTFSTMVGNNVMMIEDHAEKMNTIKRNALSEIQTKIVQYNIQLQSLNYEYERAVAREQEAKTAMKGEKPL